MQGANEVKAFLLLSSPPLAVPYPSALLVSTTGLDCVVWALPTIQRHSTRDYQYSGRLHAHEQCMVL